MLMPCLYHNKKVSRKTGEVQAEFSLKHVGHRQENAFNRMSKEMRTTIAAKLSQGISMTSVMDYIRGSMCGPLNRDHLITRADLHYIKQQYNINCMQKASWHWQCSLLGTRDAMREIQSSFVLQTTRPEIRFQWCGRKRFPTGIANAVPKRNVLKTCSEINMRRHHPRYDGIWLPASHSSCCRWLQRRYTRSVAH